MRQKRDTHWEAAICFCICLTGLSTRLCAIVCDEVLDTHYEIGLVPMLGIGFHSFIDGFIFSVTFTVSIFTGVLTATGMVPHEFPEGIITYLLLIRGGFKEKTLLVLAFLAAALTTPLGLLVSYPYISQIDNRSSAPCLHFPLVPSFT